MAYDMVWYGYQLLKLGFIVIVDIVPGSRSHPNDGVVGRGVVYAV